MKNTPEVKLLCDIINERENLQFNNVDWNKFIKLVRLHELVPLIFYRLKGRDKHIPKDIYSYLESGYRFNLIHNLKYWDEFLKVYDAFKLNNISVLPLKGIDLMVRFYPELHLRSMVDIDILVREEEFNRAEKLLCEIDFQKQLLGLREEYWREKQCHIEFDKDSFIVEVHWGLDFKRDDRIILPQLWRRIEEVQVENHRISILSPEDTLFSLALHLRRFGRILSLKQVLDVAKIINKSSKFDWDYVLKEGKENKMQATLYFILMQASLFSKAHIPTKIFKELDIPWWQKRLIKGFLLDHTFQISTSIASTKKDYLHAHFLLYDSLKESTWYIINIPYEQFCKFYGLKPYTRKADLLYRLWPPSISFNFIKFLLST